MTPLIKKSLKRAFNPLFYISLYFLSPFLTICSLNFGVLSKKQDIINSNINSFITFCKIYKKAIPAISQMKIKIQSFYLSHPTRPNLFRYVRSNLEKIVKNCLLFVTHSKIFLWQKKCFNKKNVKQSLQKSVC